MRVMHIVSKVYPYAGMERKVIQLLNRIDRNHFKPFLLSLGDVWGAPRNYLNKDIELLALHKRNGIQWILVHKMAKILKSRKIDIIHSHNWATLFHAVIAARIAKVPVIIHGEHGRDTKELDKTLKRYIIRKILYGLVDQIVVVAEDLKNIVIKEFHYNGSKVKLIKNGVEIRRFRQKFDIAEVKRKLGLSKNVFVIATIAKLRPVKDIPTLIRSFKLIHDKNPRVHLLIIGSYGENTDDLKDEIGELIEQLELDPYVKFFGEVENIPELLSVVDVYLNTSLSEGMSNTILEAMASGVPVVASRVGDNPELVLDGQTGFLADRQNPADFAVKTLKILNNPRLKRRMSENSRSIIRKYYPLEGAFQKYQDLYQALYRKKCYSLR
jgi:sugar transferase (PEP-CTERM/EpsH1 system associated)